MLVDWPVHWIAVLNFAGWPIVQLGLAWLFTRMPAHWFVAPSPGRWERGGRVYERWVAVRHWKQWLPDGAAWFRGGFAKRQLSSKDPKYLRQFQRETWRGELCHWCALAFTPVFAVWNPPWAFAVMAVCGILLNVPCILVLRFNRARVWNVLQARLTSAS